MCQRKRAPKNLNQEVESIVGEARKNCALGHSLPEQSKGVQGARELRSEAVKGLADLSRRRCVSWSAIIADLLTEA